MSSPRAATSVHRSIPFERDVNDANAFSLAAYMAKHHKQGSTQKVKIIKTVDKDTRNTELKQ